MKPRAADEQSDEALAIQASRGSHGAYRQLVERFQRPVLTLIGRMVGDAALAEDLAQETFVRAYQRLDTFDPSRRFASWLFKIAHNRTVDHLRLKRPQSVDLEAMGQDGESFEVLEAPAEQGPQRRAEASELARLIDEALAGMRPNYRQVLVLRFQAGLSYQEIADTLEVSMSSVKVLLHRARKRLASELAARGVGAPEGFR